MLVAVGIGLLGAILIWLAAPHVNYVIGASDITGSYLPVAALSLVLLLVGLVNPLLGRWRRRWMLDRGQLAVIFGLLLVASVLPGFGLLGVLPYWLARLPVAVSSDRVLAQAMDKVDAPPQLFPAPVGYDADTTVSQNFLTDLPPGQAVPWQAWLAPLLSWAVVLAFIWLMMVGLAMIVFPQWRRNERLAFPLLTVEQEMIAAPGAGRLLPPLFTRRPFWVAAVLVFLLHLLSGLHVYLPDRVPAVSLSWDLRPYFTEGPWQYMPWMMTTNRLYFIFVGIAFLIPNRVAVSVWFFALAYAAYEMGGKYYFPPYHGNTVTDHRLGAALALTAAVLWLGRRRWWEVFVSLLRPARSASQRRDRRSILMFLVGCVGTWGWLLWAGLGPVWSGALVGWGFMVSVLIARIVAETGIPFFRIHMGKQLTLLKLAPAGWVSAAAVFFAWVWVLLFNFGSRVSLAAMATHSVGLVEDAPPRRQWRLGYLMVGLMLLGLVVAGGSHLWASYHHRSSLDGRVQPLNAFGVNAFNDAQSDLREFNRGPFGRHTYSQATHILFGVAVASVLQWLCLLSPLWPIHPIGMLMVGTSYGKEAWASFFVGWLLKTLIVKFGGASFYHKARTFFLGLIVGEVVAASFWALSPIVLTWLDVQIKPVIVVP